VEWSLALPGMPAAHVAPGLKRAPAQRQSQQSYTKPTPATANGRSGGALVRPVRRIISSNCEQLHGRSEQLRARRSGGNLVLVALARIRPCWSVLATRDFETLRLATQCVEGAYTLVVRLRWLYGDWASSSAVRIVNYAHGAIGRCAASARCLVVCFTHCSYPGSRFKLYYLCRGWARRAPVRAVVVTLEATLALRAKLLQAGVSVRLVRGVEGVWSNMWSWDDRHRHPRGLCIVTR
jgi:hypothetical protein